MFHLDPQSGLIVPPGAFAKTVGGDIDAHHGWPTGFSAQLDGDCAGTTLSYPGPLTGARVTRAAGDAGFSRIKGPALGRTNNDWWVAARVRMAVRGAMTQSAAGYPAQTGRNFRFGLVDDDRLNGLYIESLTDAEDPNYGEGTYSTTGTYFVARNAGVETRVEVAEYLDEDHNRRYAMDLWLGFGRGGRFACAIGDWDRISRQATMDQTTAIGDLLNGDVKPFVEWEFVDASGNFNADIRHLSTSLFWRS